MGRRLRDKVEARRTGEEDTGTDVTLEQERWRDGWRSLGQVPRLFPLGWCLSPVGQVGVVEQNKGRDKGGMDNHQGLEEAGTIHRKMDRDN